MTDGNWSAVAPAIRTIERSAEAVGRYEKIELAFDISASFANPYEPAEVAVDAAFYSPAGSRLDVPGFFVEAMEVRGKAGEERIVPTDWSGWRVRFAPTEVGRWSYVVSVRDRGGVARTGRETFDCVPSGSAGFARVSPSDPRYFARDDGTDLFCIGSNAARFPPEEYVARYRELFANMAEHRMNWTRVWIPNFEKESGTLVRYDQTECARLDGLLAAAETNGVYLDLCMDWWRNFGAAEHSGRSGAFATDHCYWEGAGGKCETVRDFFSLPWARAQYKKRLRYTVARWGYSTSVFCWEFWNEINCVAGYEPETITAWTVEMADELRRLDPWRHLITNSFGSYMVEPTMWRLSQIDFVKVHGYWHPKLQDYDVQVRGRDMGDFVSHWVAQIRDFGKPALQGEYGMVNDDWGLSPYCVEDRAGVAIHNGAWAALHAGSAGTGMYWWTKDTIMPLDLYGVFTPLARYLDGVHLTEWDLVPREVTASHEQIRALGLVGDRHALVWLQNREYTWHRTVVEERAPTPVGGVDLELGPFERGRYRIEIWDTHAGRIVRVDTIDYANVHRYVRYRVPLPIERDLALKVEYLSGL